MKDFMKRIKADYMLSSLMCIVLGIVFVIFKAGVLDLIGNVLAIALVVIGVVYLVCYFMNFGSRFSIVSGVIILAVGLWLLIDSRIITKLIPVVLGVILLCHGIRGLQEAALSKKYKYESWYIGFLLAAISVAGGVFCIVYSYQIMQKFAVLVGIILIYNGVSNIWIASRSSKAERVYKETIDVDFNEDRR